MLRVACLLTSDSPRSVLVDYRYSCNNGNNQQFVLGANGVITTSGGKYCLELTPNKPGQGGDTGGDVLQL
jgi:hypothetical protein